MEIPNLCGESGNYFLPLDLLIDNLEKKTNELNGDFERAIKEVNKINAQFHITLPLEGKELPKKLRKGKNLDMQYEALSALTQKSVVVLYQDGIDFYQRVEVRKVENLEKAIGDEERMLGVTAVRADRFKKAAGEYGILLALPPALIVNKESGSTLIYTKYEIIKERYKASTPILVGMPGIKKKR